MSKISLKIGILVLLLALALLVFGCQTAETPSEEQLTAGVSVADGVAGSPETQETAVQPEPASEPESTEPGAETEESGDQLTGDVVAETKETKGATHFVDLTENGFKPDVLTINAGDKVVWQNVRTGHINRAMVIGVRECSKIRSSFMSPGDSFVWTFDQPATCTIVDGVMTTVQSKVIVK